MNTFAPQALFMQYISALVFVILLASSCTNDNQAAVEDDVVAADTTLAAPTPIVSTITAAGNFGEGNALADYQGTSIEYLSSCDSMSLMKLELSDPQGGARYAYLMGDCHAAGSYDLVLVPRSGHEAASAFGNPQAKLDAAKANNFADYTLYSFIYPRTKRSSDTGMEGMYPANYVVYRYDKPYWNRLGAEPVDDLSDYNDLLWRITHNGYPEFN